MMDSLSLFHTRLGELGLHGGGAAAPFRGAHFDPASGPEARVEETIDLVLESNSPGTISAGTGAVEMWLQAARDFTENRSGRPVYLQAVPVAGEQTWRSRVLSGWTEGIGGSRTAGSVGLRLHLVRENFWEGPETALPLTVPMQTRTTLPVLVYNHADADPGHDLAVEVAAQDLSGDLPGPVKLLYHSPAGPSCTKLFVGLDQDDSWGWFPMFREAGAAIGGSLETDGSCSGGHRKGCAWAGTAETELLTWDLSALDTSRAGGRFFKGLLRVPAGGTAYTDLKLRLLLKIGGTRVWEGPWILAAPGQELLELNAAQIPPSLEALENLDGVALTLAARRGTAGSHTLLVDFLSLMPLDGWRKLAARGYGLPPNQELVDDTIREVVYVDTANAKTDWVGYGSPLYLKPSRNARLYFAFVDGSQMAVDRYMHVQAWRRARRRLL